VRNCRFILLFLLSLFAVYITQCLQPARLQARSSPFPEPVVSVHYRYYPIAGNTASELRAQMNTLGPRDRRKDRTFDARTDWSVSWAFRRAMLNGRCTIRGVNTQVAITYTLPQWKTPDDVDRSLLTDWNRYFVALQHHEDGHKANGVGAGQEVLQVLRELPDASSCQELDTAAQAAAQAVIRDHNQKDLSYDAATGHGSTQGAIFPDMTTVSR